MAQQYTQTSIASGAVVAAGAAATYYATQAAAGSHAPMNAYVVFNNAITASDTNYSTYAVVTAAGTVGSFSTKTSASGGSGNIVAGDRVPFTFTSRAGVAQAGAVSVTKTESGTGQALGVNSLIAIYWEAVR